MIRILQLGPKSCDEKAKADLAAAATELMDKDKQIELAREIEKLQHVQESATIDDDLYENVLVMQRSWPASLTNNIMLDYFQILYSIAD